MRAHITNSSISTPRPRSPHPRVVALALVMGALAIPTSASASYGFVADQGPVPDKDSAGSGPLVSPDHSSLDASLAPLAPTGGSSGPEFIATTTSPVAGGDEFDWADAALGAGITGTLVAFAGGALFAFRRHPEVSPRASVG
jgi:hypothetical protein